MVLITKEMNLGEIATKYPSTIDIMFEHGLHCIGCAAARFETLEMGARAHGMDDAQIDEFVDALNKAAQKDKGKK
ncbi:DUF1858 domain-containing protein [Candidatus Woesearchaeota archaeon]|nr:DUF1858 domain-containing protein [Candidatus Woesearchaeota archaeon]